MLLYCNDGNKRSDKIGFCYEWMYHKIHLFSMVHLIMTQNISAHRHKRLHMLKFQALASILPGNINPSCRELQGNTGTSIPSLKFGPDSPLHYEAVSASWHCFKKDERRNIVGHLGHLLLIHSTIKD